MLRAAAEMSAKQDAQKGHLVDAGHHGKDGGVGDERGVHARLRQPPGQLLAPVPWRPLRHHHLRKQQES